MTITKKRLFVALAAILAIAIAAGAVWYFVQSDEKEVIKRGISMDIAMTDSLEGMIEPANFIVIGHYEELDSTVNLARNSNDISQEDSDIYIEGRIFRFKVDEVLKGELSRDTILVSHMYSMRGTVTVDNAVRENGITVKPATETQTYTYTALYPLYVEPELGATYVLFLSRETGQGYFIDATHPFIIKLDENGTASLQSGLLDKENSKLTQEIELGDSKTLLLEYGNMELIDNVSGMTLLKIKQEIENAS